MARLQGDLDPELAARAEEVRAYLVALRGGAPFLSGADARLLLGWLDAGVGVPAILAALDRVAERRRKRGTKGRLSLVACRGEVRRIAGTPGPQGSAARLAGLAARVGRLEVEPGLRQARDALAEQLLALAAQERLLADEAARRAIAACRAFHEAVWHAAERERLLRQAAAEVEPLRAGLSPEAFALLVEEVARGGLRRRYPEVSARVVWDTLAGPLPGGGCP